jgi:hypothetical protein
MGDALKSVRDVEGAAGGAKHGSEANPGTSPTALGLVCAMVSAGTPK